MPTTVHFSFAALEGRSGHSSVPGGSNLFAAGVSHTTGVQYEEAMYVSSPISASGRRVECEDSGVLDFITPPG